MLFCNGIFPLLTIYSPIVNARHAEFFIASHASDFLTDGRPSNGANSWNVFCPSLLLYRIANEWACSSAFQIHPLDFFHIQLVINDASKSLKQPSTIILCSVSKNGYAGLFSSHLEYSILSTVADSFKLLSL